MLIVENPIFLYQVVAMLLATLANLIFGLALIQGDPTPFFTRPISAVICLIIVVTISLSIPAVSKRVRALFARGRRDVPAES